MVQLKNDIMDNGKMIHDSKVDDLLVSHYPFHENVKVALSLPNDSSAEEFLYTLYGCRGQQGIALLATRAFEVIKNSSLSIKDYLYVKAIFKLRVKQNAIGEADAYNLIFVLLKNYAEYVQYQNIDQTKDYALQAASLIQLDPEQVSDIYSVFNQYSGDFDDCVLVSQYITEIIMENNRYRSPFLKTILQALDDKKLDKNQYITIDKFVGHAFSGRLILTTNGLEIKIKHMKDDFASEFISKFDKGTNAWAWAWANGVKEWVNIKNCFDPTLMLEDSIEFFDRFLNLNNLT